MTNASLPPTRSRLRGLDGLRFLAAALVVGYHFTGIRTPYWGAEPSTVFPGLNQVTRYGFIGVEFFFIISGFVILMTAYGRKIEDFAASRVSRLFPAYWVAVLLTLTLQLFWISGRQLSPREAVLNLTMLQEAFDVPNAQGAFWTLWPELKFYLLIGVFILVGITRRRVIAFAVFWPLLAQLADATDQGLLTSLLVPTYAPYFALGMMLFLVYRDGGDLVVWLGVALNLTLCLFHVTAYAGRATELVGEPVSPTVTALILLVMVLAVWAVSSGPLARVEWRWLTVLGALTYPLYLVHGQFGFFVIDVAYDSLPGYAVLGIAVAVSLALAAAIHYLVEKPFHEKLRDAVRRGLTRPARVSARKPSATEDSGQSAPTPTSSNERAHLDRSRG
ncbi:acyltransferase [Cellulosimicrobium terreum]|nr:acyltransferase [Cellulosimicrobium terreum]